MVSTGVIRPTLRFCARQARVSWQQSDNPRESATTTHSCATKPMLTTQGPSAAFLAANVTIECIEEDARL